MANVVGNLALKEARAQLEQELNGITPESWEQSAERIIEERIIAYRLREAERQSQVRELRKKTAAQRRYKILLGVTVLGLIFSMLGGLMVRQATIFANNFTNTSIRREIKEQRELNIDLQNRLAKKNDMSDIESEALRLFSLRKPSQTQRIKVELPESDHVIFYEEGFSLDPSNQNKSNNYLVLEAYMKAFNFNSSSE